MMKSINKTIPRYAQYYPVNFEYVRELPSGWQLAPNIAVFAERKQKGVPDEELLSVSIPKGVVRQSDMGKKDISSPDKSNYKLVMPGDLVYGMEFRKGAVGYSDYKGIVSPVYTILKPKFKINPRFFHYQYRTEFYKNYVWRSVYGIGEHFLPLRFKDFKRMFAIVPPLEAQNAIVAYLDRQTERANTFIAKQTRLIDVLKEQKQVLITNAVTKGLNPDAPMKASEMAWLGDIPAHWEVRKVKHVFRLSRGVDLPSDNFVKGIYPVMGSNGPIGFHNMYTCEGPGVTVGRSGSVGEVNFIEDNYWAHNTTLYLQYNYGNDIKFLYFLLKSLDLKALAEGSAVGTLNRNYIHQLLVVVPSLTEQHQIVQYIETEITKIDHAIAKAEKQIALVNEYLRSLTLRVVTGQLALERSMPQGA